MRRLCLVLLLFLATAASAQQFTPPQLTWVRQFRSEMRNEELVRAAREPLDKLLADKTIAAWGVLAPMTHIGEEWTHSVYVSTAGWAALETAVAAFDGSALLRTGMRDYVLRHVIQSETPPVVKPKFVVVNFHPVTRGRDADAFALFNEWAKPVFLDLAARGKVGPWALSVQEVVIDNTWTYAVTYFLSDLSALDDVHSELMKMGLSKLLTFERRLRDMSEDDYRGQILRVVYTAP